MFHTRIYINITRYILILIAVGIALLPIFWMVTLSFKPILEWNVGSGIFTWLPETPTISNYLFLFLRHSSAAHAIVSSLVTTTVGTLIALIIGTSAAYAVSRFKFFSGIGIAALALRLILPMVLIIPIMVMWTFLDLIDTWYGLSLVYGFLHLPFSYWLMKTFFDDVPLEIEEAAMVEGASHWRAFIRVTLPMVRGPLATSALFIFILCWSDYLVALILTSSKWATIPVYLTGITSYGPKAAMGVIATVPPIILGLLIQKHLVRGITFGALKQ